MDEKEAVWRVQTGKDRSHYTDRYTFPAEKKAMAFFYFNCLSTHSGYKKRLVNPEGKVVGRVLS